MARALFAIHGRTKSFGIPKLANDNSYPGGALVALPTVAVIFIDESTVESIAESLDSYELES